MNVSIFDRLAVSLPRPESFNPSANRFFIEDQPVDPILPLGFLIAGSPLFARYAAGARWLRGGERAMRGVWWRGLLGAAGVYAALVLYSALRGGQPGAPTALLLAEAGESAAGLLLILSLGAALLLDFACLNAAFRVLEQRAVNDLLRLSRVSNRGIIVSHYAAVRLTGWRWMISVFHLRLVGAAALIACRFVFLPLAEQAALGSASSGLNGFDQMIEYAITLCLGVVFVLEVRWRLDGVSARTLAASARRHADLPPIFVGVFSLLRLWIVQIAALGVILFFLIALSLVTINFLENSPLPAALQIVLATPCALGITVLLRFFVRRHYSIMTARELHRAERAAFAQP
ncbi:MAG: hypothetical protein L6Q98_15805 [Anaerolineae bacterium]|nr:hypothetical protein [Anaerolineae bacterium]